MLSHTRILRGLVLATLVVAASNAISAIGDPAGTAFSYQGRLKALDNMVNGPTDFQFSLWNAETGGSQIGATIELLAVEVERGLFKAELDFGANAFNGDARWLHIAVSHPVGWPYVNMATRQELTAAPYAVHSVGQSTLSAADGDPAQAVVVDADGKVGIGQTAPLSKLHIDKPIIGKDYSVGESHIYVRGSDNHYGLAIGALNGPAGGYLQTMLNNEPAPGGTSIPLFLNPGGGSVGIGTESPGQKLTVAGTVESTTGGFKFPNGVTISSPPSTIGDITAVTAGTGLTGGGSSGGVTLNVDLASGTNQGSATTVSRSSHAHNSLNAADGSPSNAVYVTNSGRVGVGTTNPQAPLDVDSSSGVPSIVTRGGNDYAVTDGQNIDIGHWDGSSFTSRLRVTPLGNLGLGLGEAMPGYRLTMPNYNDYRGYAIAHTWATWALEPALLDDIEPLDGALDAVTDLQGVRYTWKQEEGGDSGIGLVAEQVAAVAPELVTWSEDGKRVEGLDYSRLSVLLVEAVKELRGEVKSKDNEIAQLREENTKIQQRLAQLEALVARLANQNETGKHD